MIKIALVDDEELILEGVQMLLSKEKNFSVIMKHTSAVSFMQQLEQLEESKIPNIALVDIQMQPMDGFELVENLKKKYPQIKIIILSSHYKTGVLGYMVKLGVSAFLPKNSNKQLFIEAINKVYENGVFFTPEDYTMLQTYMNSSQKKKSLFDSNEELSEREKEVVQLICQENTNHEIAEKLFLSPRTIESHRQRILEKIGAKNTVGLVIYAVVHNIYTLPINL